MLPTSLGRSFLPVTFNRPATEAVVEAERVLAERCAGSLQSGNATIESRRTSYKSWLGTLF